LAFPLKKLMIKKKLRILVSGGAGFVGSHLCEKIDKEFKNCSIIILDKLTYAADKKYLKKIIAKKKHKLVKADIINYSKILNFFNKIDIAINVAAESHVDRSFNNSFEFTKTNTLGAHIFLECCKQKKVKNIYQISTDEVYGQKLIGKNDEKDKLSPTNPYAASKAAAEMIINSYNKSFKSKISILRANNIFGSRQHPEKIIPHSICSLLKNKKINIHGKGIQKRCFIHIDDFCEAVIFIIKKGENGEIYNIGSNQEIRIRDLVSLICQIMKKNYKNCTKYIVDRPFNDFRYNISYNKLLKLGWKPQLKLENELIEMIDWYKKNFRKFY
jgi:dTDP-glucose 4,6-dehydratase